MTSVTTHAGRIRGIEIAPFAHGQEDAVSEIVRRNLLEVNSSDYSPEIINHYVERFSPETIVELAASRTMLVATRDGQVVGTASFADFRTAAGPYYHLATVFVLPELHKRDIGSRLVEAVEHRARELGAATITVRSSITAKQFYEKLGYGYKDGVEAADDHGSIIMVKHLI